MSVSDSPSQSEGLPHLDARAAALVARKISRCGEPWLHNEVAQRMANRLPLIRHNTRHWIHWAPRLGGLAAQQRVTPLLAKAHQTVLQTDAADLQWAKQAMSPAWWRRLFTRSLDFSSRISHEADMVWCNMQLHMHPDPLALMRAWSEALNSQGYVMFSCLGPDSLRELRALFEEESWPPAHADFTDMHDWGDMLLQAGFAQPIMDMEHMTLTYASAEDLLRDLRTLGRNLHPQRFQALRGRAWHRQLSQALQKKLASAAHQGRLALTFKASKVAKQDEPTVVSLDDMKKMLSGRGKPL